MRLTSRIAAVILAAASASALLTACAPAPAYPLTPSVAPTESPIATPGLAPAVAVIAGDEAIVTAPRPSAPEPDATRIDSSGESARAQPAARTSERPIDAPTSTPVVVAVETPTPAPATPRAEPTAAPPPTATSHPAPAAQPAAPVSTELVAQQDYTLQLHNQVRDTIGLPPLVLDAGLNVAATRNAQDMATRNYFAHVSPEGKQPWDWIREAGVGYSTAAQNIGRYPGGAGSPNAAIKQMFDMMMAETPPNDYHRINIQSRAYHRLGVGVAVSEGRLYWVCDFAN